MKIFVSLAFMLFVGISFAQELSHKTQIIEHIGQDRFDRLDQNNSPSLIFMNERCEMGYSIIELEDEKSNNFDQLFEIEYATSDKSKTILTISDFIEMYTNGTLNILSVLLDYDQSAFTYYRLGNSGKVLVLHSVESISKSLNNK